MLSETDQAIISPEQLPPVADVRSPASIRPLSEPEAAAGKQPQSSRLKSLDVARGVACSLVLLRHAPHSKYDNGDFTSPVFSFFAAIGWVGVDLFFCLSGLLIGMIIFREIQATKYFAWRRFWVRRAFKILPAYYLIYGSAIIGIAVRSSGSLEAKKWVSSESILANSIFCQNYVNCVRWPHSWSLAIEEHFYLFAPLLLLLMLSIARRVRSPLVALAPFALFLLVAVSCILFRYMSASVAYDWKAVYYPTHMRMDALAFGLLLAQLVVFRRQFCEAIVTRRTTWLAAVAAIVVAVSPWWMPLESSKLMGVGGFTALYLAFGFLLLCLVVRDSNDLGSRWPLHMRAMGWVGGYSYTIYLAHSVVPMLPGFERSRSLFEGVVFHATSSSTAAANANRLLFICVSVVLGVLVSHGVERPFLRLRERFVR